MQDPNEIALKHLKRPTSIFEGMGLAGTGSISFGGKRIPDGPPEEDMEYIDDPVEAIVAEPVPVVDVVPLVVVPSVDTGPAMAPRPIPAGVGQVTGAIPGVGEVSPDVDAAPIASPSSDPDADESLPRNKNLKYAITKRGVAFKTFQMEDERDPETGSVKKVRREVQFHMMDFVPTIVQEDLSHVGDEVLNIYHIQGMTSRGVKLPTLLVEANDYLEMKWLSGWGADISINAAWKSGKGSITSHIREFLVERKKQIPPVKRVVYDHLGWRPMDQHWTYLHAGGGIDGTGLVSGFTVDTGLARLKKFSFDRLPVGEELKECIQASLKILDLTDVATTVPMLLAMYRATLPVQPKFGIHCHASTGAGKSTLAALLQGHFDPSSTDASLIGSWISTAASLEVLVHLAKNILVTIDDANQSVPGITKKMEHIFRANGNGTSRARMTSTMKSQRAYPPRGMVMSTGEDLPEGHSCRARLLMVDCAPVVHPGEDNSLLDGLQRDVADGKMNGAMAAFLQWLAPRIPQIEQGWTASLIQWRKSMDIQLLESHGRSIDAIAELLITGQLLLAFAQEKEAITAEQAAQYAMKFSLAFGELSKDQKVQQSAEDPIQKFLEIFPNLLMSGTCHVTNGNHTPNSGCPDTDYKMFGWLQVDRPGGLSVGKLVGDRIYLNKSTAFSAMVEYSRRSGVSFSVTEQTFWKRMAGVLVKATSKYGVGVKMSPALAAGFDSSYAPCIEVNAFPCWCEWVPKTVTPFAGRTVPLTFPAVPPLTPTGQAAPITPAGGVTPRPGSDT